MGLICDLDLMLWISTSKKKNFCCDALDVQACTFTFDSFQCCMTSSSRAQAAMGTAAAN